MVYVLIIIAALWVAVVAWAVTVEKRRVERQKAEFYAVRNRALRLLNEWAGRMRAERIATYMERQRIARIKKGRNL
jgi:hypothetical protein